MDWICKKPGYKFVKCSYEQLQSYAEEKKLKCVHEGMHILYIDEDGVEMAHDVHGFAFNEYSIAVTENEETVMMVSSIIDKFSR